MIVSPTKEARHVYRLGTWNVRTLRSREEEVIREMKRYNLDVLGLSETKVRGNGMKEIDGAKYVYAGVSEGRAKCGVGIVVAESLADCVRSWRCVSERCVMIRLRVAGVWMTLVQVYAPTDDRDSDTKDGFYAQLQEVVERAPREDKVVVLGDFNARVGNDVEEWNGVIGKHGEETRNESGTRLLRFSAENEFSIMNTHFEHKEIHKFTWECPGRGLRSIIDYFLVRVDMRRDINDVRVIRGAEVGSDHHLLLMKMKVRGRKQAKKEEKKSQLRSGRLQTKEGRLKYYIRLNNKMKEAKCVNGDNVEAAWNEFKSAVLEVAEVVCGRKKCRKEKRTSWWSKEVEQAVKSKKEAYKRWLQVKSADAKEEYLKAKRVASHIVRNAKNEEWKKFGETLQEDFQHNQRRFWAKIRARRKGDNEVGRVCDDSGQVLCEEEEVRKRWKEYFAALLQGEGVQQNEHKRNASVGEVPAEATDEKISVEEVRSSICRLKNGKAPGVCGITGGMLKAGGEAVVQWLHKIVDLAWSSGNVPMDWQKAVIVPIHKKGSKTQCKNYRGISLLSIPGKVYASVLEKRIRAITERKVLEEQGAFRRGRSCVDQLFIVRQLGEKIIEKNRRMLMVCVDLEKAYDRVDRELLWKVLRTYGVNGALMRAVKSLYENSKACVIVQGKESDWFKVGQGVRQGCTMSPWLFNIFMDNIVREAKQRFDGGVEMELGTIQLLLFADDLMLVAERDEDAERNMKVLEEVMTKWRMTINWGKTKAMVVKRGGGTCNITVNGIEIENVRTMKYLGAMLDEEGSCEAEVDHRIGAASKVIGALREEVIERRELNKSTKLRVINATVMPTLLYASETWTLLERHKSKVQAFEMRCLRKVEGVTMLDKVRNEEVRSRLGQVAVLSRVEKKQTEWARKVEDMTDDRMVKKVFVQSVPGKRPRGRPRKRWTDDLKMK